MILSPPPLDDNSPALSAWCDELYNELLKYKTLGNRYVVAASSTSVSTSGTGEDTLQSVIIPRYYHMVHRGLNIKAAGTKTNSNGNKTLKFYYGLTSVTFSPASNDADDWFFEGTILFEDYNSQRIYWAGALAIRQYDTASEDMNAGDVTLKLTGECVNASDTVTQTMGIIETF